MTRKLHPNQAIAGLSGLTVEDFWIWAYSDVLHDVARNAFAEFLVGFALGVLIKPRQPWDAEDFNYRDRIVSVKAAAYTQSWPQNTKTRLAFDIALKKGQTKHKSDCVVFALFMYDDYNDKEAAQMSIIDTAAWRFFVIPTARLNAEQKGKKTVGLKWIEAICACEGGVPFSDLKRKIDTVLGFKD